ncbi:M50 family metallopeptidase [Paenibacillus abyssi]|uniref:Stage IV sporulation protein FB n=1 Tax=Paenibacillus abyssi TaxID=1340531 RepID=A0A917G3N4_9BACL|nr:M50 family metallopeptidase [Paenibacillus abyssi]GGG20327.1 stage IV sporulation protein FB [Paenibacillus abyssi]
MIRWKGIIWSIHPLFVLVMLASVVTGYFIELITLFAIVIVHELGHVLAARGLGWTVREVKLLPFGGVAEIEEAGYIPAKEEMFIAAAGPLQNGWMAAAAFALGQWGGLSSEWSEHFVQANMMIGLFNLLPVLPLDGGKLLQALLSYRIPFHITLVWGARISLLFSASMVIYALVIGWPTGIQMNVLTIGIFLFVSNWTYLRNVPYIFVRFLMRREQAAANRVWQGALAQPIVVTGHNTVHAILRLFMKERYHLIYVMGERGAIVAVLPEERVVDGFLIHGKAGSAVHELFR